MAANVADLVTLTFSEITIVTSLELNTQKLHHGVEVGERYLSDFLYYIY